jgi:translation initiation factor IF-2
MTQMFRVGDLASQMGVSVDELIFKLRSIGVDINSQDDTLDLSTVRDIITGQTLLRRPREVIVRKEPAAEEQRRSTSSAIERIKRRRSSRRFATDVPDEVPDLSTMAVPPPPAPPAAASVAETDAAMEEAVAVPEAPAETEAETAKAAAAAPPEEAEPEAEAFEKPAKKPARKRRKAAAKAIEEAEVEPDVAAVAAEDAAAVQEPRAEAEQPPTQPARETAAPPTREGRARAAKKEAKTPLEAQLRELSDDEVRQRILAAKKAAPAKPAVAPARGRGGRKAKAAADADEIRELLAKFEESKVRAASDAAPAAPRAPVPAGRSRPQRVRRARGEAPTVRQAVTLEFRDGGKPEGPIYLSEAVTVRELAEKLNVLVKDLMAYLISKKIFVVANQTLPRELAEQICEEVGVEAMVVSFEEEIDLQQEETTELVGKSVPRPPVVTVMGHVDHGKTLLLDAIRSTRVAAGEAGGITQHIGASHIEHHGKPIVFIDTPGHEAFTQMRARGASVTDLVVLVVAADDGVMPQTVEAINHARAAKVPILVAINKIDKPTANVDRVKQGLSSENVLVEDWGGDVPAVEVSALKKKGIDDLLELILLVADMESLSAVEEGPARGAVLEARKEKGRGVVATVLVQQGTLDQGDCFFAGATYGRVRAMLDTDRKPVKQARPSDAVEIMGFEDVPEAGDTFQVVESEARAREVAAHRQARQKEEELQTGGRKVSLEGLMDQIRAEEVKALNVVLKADVQGSAEVLKQTLARLSTDEVSINVLHASVGGITANDILLSSASQAVVIGFNVRPDKSAKELAEREGVDVRLYTVIYDLTEDVQKAMAGLLAPTYREEDLGRAEVREVFHITKVGTVAGCMVLDGAIPRSARARLLRDNVVVWEGSISSLKRFKEDVAEVRNGFECGISLERYQDIKVGDVIEAFRSVEVARQV